MWLLLADTAQTGDSRNIVLWVVLAAIALVLIIASLVMSAVAKKKDQSDKHDRK